MNTNFISTQKPLILILRFLGYFCFSSNSFEVNQIQMALNVILSSYLICYMSWTFDNDWYSFSTEPVVKFLANLIDTVGYCIPSTFGVMANLFKTYDQIDFFKHLMIFEEKILSVDSRRILKMKKSKQKETIILIAVKFLLVLILDAEYTAISDEYEILASIFYGIFLFYFVMQCLFLSTVMRYLSDYKQHKISKIQKHQGISGISKITQRTHKSIKIIR